MSDLASADPVREPPPDEPPSYDAVQVGDTIGVHTFALTRSDLVRYAGASGDFNPIHWSDRVAREVGLPGVIAHGMFTMATAVRLVTEWVADPGAIVEYGVRFTRPVPVHDVDGARIEVSGVVATKDDESRTLRVDLTAALPADDGGKVTVLGRARAVVRLA